MKIKILAVLFYLLAAFSVFAEEDKNVYLEPISDASAGYTVDDQKYLFERAQSAFAVIKDIDIAAIDGIKEFRKTQKHEELKAQLAAFVDNETAYPEYAYVSRLKNDNTKYEYLFSSSNIIEDHEPGDYDLSYGMQIALEKNKSAVPDFSKQPQAVYMPISKENKIIGFLVFVKLSWDDSTRRINPVKDKELNPENFARLKKEFDILDKKVALLEEKMKANSKQDNTYMNYESSIKDEGLIKLLYGKGEMHSFKSLGGSGHLIMFDSPDAAAALKYIEIFGSRYGEQQPPDEDFTVYILDENLKEIKSFKYPYSLFKREIRQWIPLEISEEIKPGKKFGVCVDFKPHQTKGIYLGIEYTKGESHSKTGLPSKVFSNYNIEGDWMIRAYLKNPNAVKAEKEVKESTEIKVEKAEKTENAEKAEKPEINEANYPK